MSTEPSERTTHERTVAEFSEVFYERDRAVLLAIKAGFPKSRLPAFTTPLTFWNKLIEQARNGVLPGGVRSLFEMVATMYPGNRMFASHLPAPQRAGLREASDDAPPRRRSIHRGGKSTGTSASWLLVTLGLGTGVAQWTTDSTPDRRPEPVRLDQRAANTLVEHEGDERPDLSRETSSAMGSATTNERVTLGTSSAVKTGNDHDGHDDVAAISPNESAPLESRPGQEITPRKRSRRPAPRSQNRSAEVLVPDYTSQEAEDAVVISKMQDRITTQCGTPRKWVRITVEGVISPEGKPTYVRVKAPDESEPCVKQVVEQMEFSKRANETRAPLKKFTMLL